MKKGKIKYIFFIVICCFLAGSFATVSADTTDLQEDFSAYPPGPGMGGLSGGTSVGAVTESIEASLSGHSNVFQVVSTTDPASAIYGAVATTASTQITTVEFDLYSSASGADGVIAAAYIYDNYEAGIALDVVTGRIYAVTVGGGNVDMGPLTNQTWYTFRLVLNYATETYDVYINGTMPAEGNDVPMDTSIAATGSAFLFVFGSATATMTGAIDNIRVVSVSPVNPPTGDRSNFRWIIYFAAAAMAMAGSVLAIKKRKAAR